MLNAEFLITNDAGPALVVNMRAFKDGLVPSVTNGAVMELNYVGFCSNEGSSGVNQEIQRLKQ